MEHGIDLMRNDFSRNLPAPQAGAYTMLILADDHLGDAYPGGEGALVVSVGANGKIRAVGTLGDGERFSSAGFLSADGEWPLFKALYRTRPKGHIGGVLTFRDQANVSDFDGILQWVRHPDVRGRTFPFGFKLHAAAVGSTYTRPAVGTVALDGSVAPLISEFRLEGGGVPGGLTPRQIDWLAGGKVMHVPTGGTEIIRIRFNERSGAIRASYRDGPLNIRTINGVVLQKQDIASGQFLNGKVTGRMTMVPIESRQGSNPATMVLQRLSWRQGRTESKMPISAASPS